MAVNVFPSAVGVPQVLTDPFAFPMSFSLGGFGNFATTYCILQGCTGTTQGNYQFLLTLRNFTYVYIFGEKMGDFTVTGLAAAGAYAGNCNSISATTGMTAAIAYYNNQAISVTGTPVAISMANWSAWAFLVGAVFTHMNPRSGIGQFQFKLKTITQ